mgnify:FL=1
MKSITKKAMERYRSYLVESEKSAATVEKYLRDLRAFAAWIKGAELCKAAVLSYKEKITAEYAPASVNSMLSSLNSFFDYAGAPELKVKTLKIQRRIFASDERELKKEEYGRLLSAAKKKGKRLFLLLQTVCSTGIRVSELRYITVSAVKSGRADIRLKGKMRTILLPDELCRMLRRYAAERNITEGSIFVSRKGTPVNRSTVWRMFKKLCGEAGVERQKVFPHNLRHLFARTFYAAQKDIVRLADILGHSNINTTRIYTMESGEIFRSTLTNLGLLRC